MDARTLSTRLGWTAYLAIGTGLSAAYFVLPASANVEHAIYQLIGISGLVAIACGIAVRRCSGVAWWMILLGLTLWVAGDGYWNAYRWLEGVEAPFPSPADALYILAYLPLLIGIGLLVRGGRPRAADVLDASIIGLAAGLTVWFAAIAPAAQAQQGSTLASLLVVVYPAMDYLLLVGVVQLSFAGGLRNVSLRWVSFAFATVLVTDVLVRADADRRQLHGRLVRQHRLLRLLRAARSGGAGAVPRCRRRPGRSVRPADVAASGAAGGSAARVAGRGRPRRGQQLRGRPHAGADRCPDLAAGAASARAAVRRARPDRRRAAHRPAGADGDGVSRRPDPARQPSRAV